MDEKTEVREPSRHTLVSWVVDWIVAADPKEGTTVPKTDIEQLTGLKWASAELCFVLIQANAKLRGSTHYEWSVTKDGLYMLTDAERVDRNGLEQRRRLQASRRAMERAGTIRREKLSPAARADLECQARLALQAYEHEKRIAKNERLLGGKPPEKDEGGTLVKA